MGERIGRAIAQLAVARFQCSEAIVGRVGEGGRRHPLDTFDGGFKTAQGLLETLAFHGHTLA